MAPSQKSRYLRGYGRRSKLSARRSQILLLIFFVGIAATVGYVWERAQVVRQQILISELESEMRKLETENEYLRLELLHLSDAMHLEKVAGRFGFIHPSAEQIVRLPQ